MAFIYQPLRLNLICFCNIFHIPLPMSKVRKPVVRKKDVYIMPEPIPTGEVLTDVVKKQWKIGPSIGKGGFGEIYSACENGSTTETYPYVIKIEHHANGPLFVEMHFYMRNAKKDDVAEYCKSNSMTRIGMPLYIASGSHVLSNGNKYRFIVMKKFARDLFSYYKECKNKIPLHTVYKLAIQMTDVLEYIHSRNYVHADLKASNILLDTDLTQAYLVDFGLAAHYNTKEYKPDPKKMHNGTIEYTSRDAHQGVLTRRGDFEILLYNLIHWCGGSLPWDKKLTDPEIVQKMKEEHMLHIAAFINNCFTRSAPGPITEFATLVSELKHNQAPEYIKYKFLFSNAIRALGKPVLGKLEFERKADESDDDTPVTKKLRISPKVKIIKSKFVLKPRKLVKKKALSKDNDLKKTKDVLEYSFCDDEQVEIIVNKTNMRTGAVTTTRKTQEKTDILIQKGVGYASGSTRRSTRGRYSSEGDITDQVSVLSSTNNRRQRKPVNHNDSLLGDISDGEKIEKLSRAKSSRNTHAQTESNWKNCPTVKASGVTKPGTYKKLKK